MNTVSQIEDISPKEILIKALSRTQISPTESLEHLKKAGVHIMPLGDIKNWEHTIKVKSDILSVSDTEISQKQIEEWLNMIDFTDEEFYVFQQYLFLVAIGSLIEIKKFRGEDFEHTSISNIFSLLKESITKYIHPELKKYRNNTYQKINDIIDKQMQSLSSELSECSKETIEEVFTKVQDRINRLFL